MYFYLKRGKGYKKFKKMRLLTITLLLTTLLSLNPSIDNNINSYHLRSDIPTNINTPNATFDNDYFNESNNNSISSSFSMAYYFENSMQLMPKNHNSCGFVSLIQVLSYYDSYYNDDVIHDRYELSKHNNYAIDDLRYYSPGVYVENYSFTDNSEYKNYCISSQDYNLQSYLTIQHNILEGTMNKDSSKFETSMHLRSYRNLLNNVTQMTSLRFNIIEDYDFLETTYIHKQTYYKNTIKDYINQGYPVIVHIKDTESDNEVRYHSLVAYKIIGGEIYANFGYKNQIYCDLPLLSLGYEYINAFAVLIPTFDHTHSDNYVMNGFNYCGCGLSLNHFTATTTDWNNIPPTFTWTKNPLDIEESYRLEFKLSLTGPIIYTYNTVYNNVTLSINSRTMIRNYTSTYLYVFLVRESNLYFLPSIHLIINDPYKDMPHYTFNSNSISDFSNTQISQTKNVNFEDKQITIESVGCYIENSNVVLSSFNDVSNNSYVSFQSNSIYRMDINLSFYSLQDVLSTGVGASILLQYMENTTNQWLTFENLTNFLSLNLNDLKIIFPNCVSGVKLTILMPASGEFKIKIGGIKLYVN